jgi:IclR family KDG regulon transcriptional repressor
LGLSTTTTYRLLQTLTQHNYIQQDPDNKKYSLGFKLLELSSIFLTQSDIRKLSMPAMQVLRDDCKETVNLAILDGPDVIYVDKLDALLPISYVGSSIGRRAPAYCTAIGKAMLAFKNEEEIHQLYQQNPLNAYTPNTITSVDQLLKNLSDIRARGYAEDNEEIQIGVKCLAVPVWKRPMVPVAAISVSGPVERIDQAISEDDLISKVMEAGRQISQRLSATT